MLHNPKVSIVIPVYNGSNYLKEAIESALAQTYDNIEVIVVNDGSNDVGKTEAIAKSFGDKIRYFWKENGGVATALNLGISNAEGEYISWLSHDDLYYPHKIKVQIDYLNKQNDRNIILFSNFNVKNYINNSEYTSPPIKNYANTVFDMLYVLFSSSIHGCSILLPKRCFESVGLFSTSLRTTQDYEYWFKLYRNGYIFHYMPESLILTRHHKDQDTNRLITVHIEEVNNLYIWAFELFLKEFQSFSEAQLGQFINLMKSRGLMEAYARIAELRNYKNNILQISEGKPVIWLYWENRKSKTTPAIIKLCRETIIRKNEKDFLIIVTNPQNIFYYLPNLNKDCLLFEQIAHRADYIRYNLLYSYGGIWLDSDFIAFKSLKPVLNEIEEHGFVYTGYLQGDGEVFPLICFLGAKKYNPILRELIVNINKILETKVKNGFQPEWNEIGGSALQKYLNDKNSYRFESNLFAPIDVHSNGQIKIFLPIKISKVQRNNSYGQMLPYSLHSEFFQVMGDDILKMKCYLSDELNKNLGIIFRFNLFINMYFYIKRIRELGLRESISRCIHIPLNWFQQWRSSGKT